MNFQPVEPDNELVLELVGDHAGGHSAEHLAVFAGLDLDDANELGHALGQFAHGIELVGFTLGAALLERFQAALVGLRYGNREALRKEIVAGGAGCDLDLGGLAAAVADVSGEN